MYNSKKRHKSEGGLITFFFYSSHNILKVFCKSKKNISVYTYSFISDVCVCVCMYMYIVIRAMIS